VTVARKRGRKRVFDLVVSLSTDFDLVSIVLGKHILSRDGLRSGHIALPFVVSSLFKPDERPMHFGTPDIPLVSCAKCGRRLFVPEASDYSDAHNVRHQWKCGHCGHFFDSNIDLGAQRGRRRSDRQRPLSAPRGSWW
jgi:hypothetical protein